MSNEPEAPQQAGEPKDAVRVDAYTLPASSEIFIVVIWDDICWDWDATFFTAKDAKEYVHLHYKNQPHEIHRLTCGAPDA